MASSCRDSGLFSNSLESKEGKSGAKKGNKIMYQKTPGAKIKCTEKTKYYIKI